MHAHQEVHYAKDQTELLKGAISMSSERSTAENGSQQAPVLEMVLYRLQAVVTSETILALSDEIQEWLEEQPGYLRRELFMAEDGQWLDLVYWASMAEAVTASGQIYAQPFAANFGTIFAPDVIGFPRSPPTFRHQPP
jgi:hypothetical protein